MLELEELASETPPEQKVERTLFETILQNFGECINDEDIKIIDLSIINTFIGNVSKSTTIKKLVSMPDFSTQIIDCIDMITEVRKSKKIITNLNQIVTKNLASNMEFDYMEELNKNDGSAICI